LQRLPLPVSFDLRHINVRCIVRKLRIILNVVGIRSDNNNDDDDDDDDKQQTTMTTTTTTKQTYRC